jgi:hypothetical protein
MADGEMIKVNEEAHIEIMKLIVEQQRVGDKISLIKKVLGVPPEWGYDLKVKGFAPAPVEK